ncbi:hypothetical protein [Hymenobacter edaphi]|uniref:hypothetical protein n=1 Tax=Hymenobacter edaphi TaxID=2211146 RepID=UPI001058130B|nr:hypothetical protein [Hymenobacter edaphi]
MQATSLTTASNLESGVDAVSTTDGLLVADVSKVEEALRRGAAVRIGDIIVGLFPTLDGPA